MNGMTPLARPNTDRSTATIDSTAQREQIIAWTRRYGQETLKSAWRAAEKGNAYDVTRSQNQS